MKKKLKYTVVMWKTLRLLASAKQDQLDINVLSSSNQSNYTIDFYCNRNCEIIFLSVTLFSQELVLALLMRCTISTVTLLFLIYNIE